MKKRIKTKWLKALRSGEYKQTVGRLRDTRGFCCLGVLCDIYAKEKNIEWVSGGCDYLINNNGGLLCQVILDWAGMPEQQNSIEVTLNKNKTTLSTLNDVDKKSFKQIANIIEKQL